MKNWEKIYEQLRNGEVDKELESIKEKMDKKTATKEEYEKYKKMSRAKDNVRQIENVIEYKDKLEQFLEDIDNEFEIREELKGLNKEQEKLEDDLNRLQKEYDDIQKELKSNSLKNEEKNELTEKLQKVRTSIDDNNRLFAENQKGFEKISSNRNEELEEKSDNELNSLALNVSSSISKCNMVARNLVDGNSWDAIDYKLSKWKENTKYTKRKEAKSEINKDKTHENTISYEDIISDEEKYKKYKKMRENNIKSEQNDFEEEIEGKIGEEIEGEIEEEIEEEKSEYESKRPMLSKIRNWFKSIVNKIKTKKLPVGKEEIEEKVENEMPEEEKNRDEFQEEKFEYKVNETPHKEKIREEDLLLENPFMDRIKIIAEKGADGVSLEEKAVKQLEMKKKLEELRKANRKNEAKKFGQQYADKSDYRQKDDERDK